MILREKIRADTNIVLSRNEAPAIEWTFGEIVWPDDVVLPWKPCAEIPEDDSADAELRRRFGEPFFVSESKLVGMDLDENFVATPGASVTKGLVGGDWFNAEMKIGSTPR